MQILAQSQTNNIRAMFFERLSRVLLVTLSKYLFYQRREGRKYTHFQSEFSVVEAKCRSYRKLRKLRSLFGNGKSKNVCGTSMQWFIWTEIRSEKPLKN